MADITYEDLSSKVGSKPTSSLSTANTNINQLLAETTAFTTTGSSDISIAYETPDVNDISVVMSEYSAELKY